MLTGTVTHQEAVQFMPARESSILTPCKKGKIEGMVDGKPKKN